MFFFSFPTSTFEGCEFLLSGHCKDAFDGRRKEKKMITESRHNVLYFGRRDIPRVIQNVGDLLRRKAAFLRQIFVNSAFGHSIWEYAQVTAKLCIQLMDVIVPQNGFQTPFIRFLHDYGIVFDKKNAVQLPVAVPHLTFLKNGGRDFFQTPVATVITSYRALLLRLCLCPHTAVCLWA